MPDTVPSAGCCYPCHHEGAGGPQRHRTAGFHDLREEKASLPMVHFSLKTSAKAGSPVTTTSYFRPFFPFLCRAVLLSMGLLKKSNGGLSCESKLVVRWIEGQTRNHSRPAVNKAWSAGHLLVPCAFFLQDELLPRRRHSL